MGKYVDFPGSQGHYYAYCRVNELEKFAVKNGIIMAYTEYVDEEADAYIQENFYHWFVLIPEKEITESFHTEDEFLEYVQALDIGNYQVKRKNSSGKPVVWIGSQTASDLRLHNRDPSGTSRLALKWPDDFFNKRLDFLKSRKPFY